MDNTVALTCHFENTPSTVTHISLILSIFLIQNSAKANDRVQLDIKEHVSKSLIFMEKTTTTTTTTKFTMFGYKEFWDTLYRHNGNFDFGVKLSKRIFLYGMTSSFFLDA